MFLFIHYITVVFYVFEWLIGEWEWNIFAIEMLLRSLIPYATSFLSKIRLLLGFHIVFFWLICVIFSNTKQKLTTCFYMSDCYLFPVSVSTSPVFKSIRYQLFSSSFNSIFRGTELLKFTFTKSLNYACPLRKKNWSSTK